jgi:hypothetical protein
MVIGWPSSAVAKVMRRGRRRGIRSAVFMAFKKRDVVRDGVGRRVICMS